KHDDPKLSHLSPSPSPSIVGSNTPSFSKTHSKEGRPFNDQWFPSVEVFGRRETLEEGKELFSFSPEYYPKGKRSFFSFSETSHIVYNQI
ncbi:MAG TPA: hypothetical protein VEL68_07945, partial [Thermodesulfobacteriota bacterium]|nr:hypothetical protein [Thermodesulfobacteriota bacterium]